MLRHCLYFDPLRQQELLVLFLFKYLTVFAQSLYKTEIKYAVGVRIHPVAFH